MGRLTAVLLVAAALAVVDVRSSVVGPVRVTGDSMSPTLHNGAVVLVDKRDRRPERGDIITFDAPDDGAPTVKRVVGVGGDVVAVEDAILRVNGSVVDEPYVDHESIDALYYGPVTVPAGSLLVLGDQRAGSIDSREYGAVPSEAVTGRVLARLLR
jgi:signal peptidase I